MAHTDNTLPWRLWSEHGVPDNLRRWKGRHESAVKEYRREHNRRDRHDARAQLHREGDAEPRQPRGRAIWDAL